MELLLGPSKKTVAKELENRELSKVINEDKKLRHNLDIRLRAIEATLPVRIQHDRSK